MPWSWAQRALATATLLGGSLTAQPTGLPAPELAGVDSLMADLLARHNVPGAAVAFSFRGRLVFARGYGFADRDAAEPVRPETLFRVASVSKLVTAAAMMRLVEEGRIALDDRVFGDVLAPERFGTPADPRAYDITVRDLLRHSGGWDRELSFDPANVLPQLAREVGDPAPGGCKSAIRAMLRRTLDFSPGTRAQYSNFGYCVLGAVIEATTGQEYERYVREKLLAPVGITRMRVGGRLEGGRLPGETRYYDHPGAGQGPSPYPDGPSQLPWPYGGFLLDDLGAYGGWVASAPDLVRLMDALEGRAQSFALAPESVEAMQAHPDVTIPNDGFHYGYGLFVRDLAGGGAHWWHGGSIPGTYAYLVRTAWGATFAAVFNSLPRNAGELSAELDRRMLDIARTTTQWPAVDLSPELFPPAGDAPGAVAAVDAAAYTPQVARGAWVSIFGERLAARAQSWSEELFPEGRLPLSLAGVEVRVLGRRCAAAYVSPGQLNVLIPAATPAGPVWAQVIRDGIPGEPFVLQVADLAPRLFSRPSGEGSIVAAVFPDGALVGDTATEPQARSPAAGDTVSLYATGLGAFPTDTLVPAPISLSEPALVNIGESAATVLFAGLVGPGLFQLNVVVPELPAGAYDVTIQIGQAISPAGLKLPVR